MIGIEIVNYPGAQAAAVLGMTDLLLAAGAIGEREDRGQTLVVSHWKHDKGLGRMVREFGFGPDEGSQPAVCIMPPALAGPPARDPVLTEWLLARHAEGAVLASVCTGAFVLGDTGLFNGRTVTTHWTYEERFQKQFPQARIDTGRLVIDDGDLMTAGGVMSWTDLVLTIIERFMGHAVMLEVARGFLLDPPGRQQSYYSTFVPHLEHGDEAILKVQSWLRDTEARDVGISTLSAVAGLEDRTFLRRFHKATGLTTTEYWQRLRVARAQVLLQGTRLPTDQIAWDVGYGDPSAFRKVFHRIVGLPPSEYRRRFSVRNAEGCE